MRSSFTTRAAVRATLATIVFALPFSARGAKPAPVEARFGLAAPGEGPFPADRFTVADPAQNTCERVNLPKPDCSAAHNDCVELDQVNQLDGFNPRTRVTVPFSGLVDETTLEGDTIFLLDLGDAMAGGRPDCAPPPTCAEGDDACDPPPAGAGGIVKLNQRLWDPETNTFVAESDQLLLQHRRYALIVTRGVHDKAGDEVQASHAFKRAIGDEPADGAAADAAYDAWLRRAVDRARFAGIRRHDIVAASVFTTMSVTAVLEKLRDYVKAEPLPAPPSFALGPNGERTVFARADVTKVVVNAQTTVSGALAPPSDITLRRFKVLSVVPGAPDAVSAIAFGKTRSPFFLRGDVSLTSFPTFSGTPVPTTGAPDGSNDLYFNVFVPAGTPPAGGWPVVIWTDGSGDSKDNTPFTVAAKLATHGLATIGINIVGHGFGPRSTISVTRTTPPSGEPATLTFLTGGRGVDVDGDGKITNIEGSQAIGDLRYVTQNSDAIRQNMADYVQLVRVIRAGVDWTGDGVRDLDPDRIYMAGHSLTAGAAFLMLALEPEVRAVTVSGIGAGSAPYILPANRGLFAAQFLAVRQPTLINPLPQSDPRLVKAIEGVATTQPYFAENIPKRDQPIVVNDVPGALAIQEFIERAEWIQTGTSPGAFAPYVRAAPLPGIPPRPFIVFMLRGDQQVPNVGQAELARLGGFADRLTLYRHDLFPSRMDQPNPHGLVARTDGTIPSFVPIALQMQDEIGEFFETDGAFTKDPDPAEPLCPGATGCWEVPASFIPSDIGFIRN
jgi:hypothetical protein